jgi:LuxR family maltose regulon positive regulatory protein
MPRSPLAKLSRPRLYDAVPRERLFGSLDAKRNHNVIWVTGPPGSGKSTLLASYVEAAHVPAAWYLLDSGDSDPATFFYYLSQVAAGSRRGLDKPLPLLTEEYLSDLEGFARRFVRDTFALLAPGSLLVLDNYHEIASDSPLHTMLNAAFEEIPQDANIVVISRAQPPAVFTRARMTGVLELLDWEELRLDLEETAAIAAKRKGLDSNAVSTIHARAAGWVAGVRLLLERTDHSAVAANWSQPETLASTFDYFAAEIFDSAGEPLRNLLLRTAFLPRFTVPMAAAISGDGEAGQRLAELYKRHLFLDRHLGEEVAYQYHDLFRAFLRNRAIQSLTPEQTVSLISHSAMLLRSANLAEEAFALFVEAKDWEQAEDVFTESAKALIARGRWLTLNEWSSLLPQDRVQANPWLRYWIGRSKALVDPVQAAEILQASFSSFESMGDLRGILFSAAAVLETLHFTADHWNEMRAWLERLTSALARHADALSPDDELRVHATLFWAAQNTFPGNPAINAGAQRVMQLLPACTDVNLRVSAANMLNYLAVHTLDQEFTRLAAREARPYLNSPDLSADRLALYYLSEGMAHVDPGRFEEALACYKDAEAIIERTGLENRRRLLWVWRALCHHMAGNLTAARSCIEALEHLPGTDPEVIAQCLANARAMVHARLGETKNALKWTRVYRSSVERFGPVAQLGFGLPNQAYMLIADGRAEEADEPLTAIRAHGELVRSMHFGSSIALMEAWRALRLGDDEGCREALSRTLTLSRHEGERWRLRWFPLALAEVIPIALEHSIEPTIARTVLKEARVRPPMHASDAWPWRLKIYTLGRFEVLVDDAPLEFGRKAPKRTMALLKALIASGSTEVSEQRLADVLWPDLDGDGALEALAAALHRLRRLIGGNDTIVQSNGTLSINREECYVDAQAFEGMVQSCKQSLAIALYQGTFLPTDLDELWTTSMRERLRGKFVRAIEITADGLEARSQYEEAIALYLRGLDSDDLIEPFYRGLMRCYHRLGRHAEAVSTFRRLRRTLSATLGAKPSAESQKLYQDLQLN